MVAQTYLEGTYSEVYPNISQDEAGLKKLFKQFSFPGGIPSHVAPETPGSIHEGGRAGLLPGPRLRRGAGQPRPYRRLRGGGREAETGPLATAWQGQQVLKPHRGRGRAPPSSTSMGLRSTTPPSSPASPTASWRVSSGAAAGNPRFVEGSDPEQMHQTMAAALDWAIREIQRIQAHARTTGDDSRPAWPMIVLRTPKGWTGPKEVDGQTIEGSFRAHQVPIDMSQPHHLKLVEDWPRLPPRGALHRGGQAPPRTPGPGPQGGPADGGQPPRQRRQAARGT